MKCPYCNHPDTRVIDSRPADDGNSIRRRRSCDVCGKRFTTYEKVETIPLIIIKKDNNREQYNRGKIETGILRACYKRPVSAAEIQKCIDRVETKIFSLEEKEIPSSTIGEIVMDELKRLEAGRARHVYVGERCGVRRRVEGRHEERQRFFLCMQNIRLIPSIGKYIDRKHFLEIQMEGCLMQTYIRIPCLL